VADTFPTPNDIGVSPAIGRERGPDRVLLVTVNFPVSLIRNAFGQLKTGYGHVASKQRLAIGAAAGSEARQARQREHSCISILAE
jgi:hypothetical protein